jgi:GNAT superfamily N-acetyltransferase
MLRDGTPVRIRAMRSDDKERLRSGFARLSPKSIYQRFFQTVKALTPNELRNLTELDFHDRAALALTTDDGGDERFIGVARFARIASGSERAEMALVVADAYQHRGAGSLLVGHLLSIARALGVRELLALVLEDNDEMLELLRSCDLPLTHELDHGIRRVVLTL